MNTSDRLNKIATVAENVNAKEVEAQNKKQALIDHIATYANRIKAIIEVGSKLVENKMPLGKNDCFESSGISHRFGFMVDGNRLFSPDRWNIIGIGSEGGGWAGSDLTVNANGEVVSYSSRYNCESWTEDFEAFEEAFYNYVDNEI